MGGRLHVLGFGAKRWADAKTAELYERTLGQRSAQFVCTEQHPSGSPALHVPWWLFNRDGGYLAIDPLTLCFTRGLVQLQNALSCPLPRLGVPPEHSWDVGEHPTGCPLRGTERGSPESSRSTRPSLAAATTAR